MSLFGTDGVRGIPGQGVLSADSVRRLGLAAARVFMEARGVLDDGLPPKVFMGRDTRRSGPTVARWLVEGLARGGCAVADVGVATTPAVAYLTARRRALFGVVISASHNPPEFNGIKFFGPSGHKASPAVEHAIEARMPDSGVEPRDRGGAVWERRPGDVRDYLDFLRSAIPSDCDFGGLRVVLDAGNGAAAMTAPGLLRSLGAEVFALGCSPNGDNINAGCGALETDAMRRTVVARGADCGIALDGDADRAVFSDEKGRLLDGDYVIAMAALDLQRQGLLRGGAVVLTVMSNLGLIRFLEANGIGTRQVPVGDRNVTEALDAEGLSLGGEASGHIVFRRLAPTGDGLATALQTLAVLARSKKRMSAFRSLYRTYPQVLKNVRVERRVPLEELPRTRSEIRRCEKRLAGKGRVFVRYSGTEPLLRILAEGPDGAEVRALSDHLAKVFREETDLKK
ncbi:MAG TPA: phosphoglucosamine mutase [Elusimicrobiota bacterium]|nr:phosphoglucosamine mutase [Elusimicrobiota bacterium]